MFLLVRWRGGRQTHLVKEAAKTILNRRKGHAPFDGDTELHRPQATRLLVKEANRFVGLNAVSNGKVGVRDDVKDVLAAGEAVIVHAKVLDAVSEALPEPGNLGLAQAVQKRRPGRKRRTSRDEHRNQTNDESPHVHRNAWSDLGRPTGSSSQENHHPDCRVNGVTPHRRLHPTVSPVRRTLESWSAAATEPMR